MIHCPNTTHIALIAKLIENETKRKLMMEMCDDTNIYGQRGNIIAVNKSVLYLPYTYLLNVVSPCNRWPTSVLRLALRCRCWLISQCNIIAPFMKETPTQVYYPLSRKKVQILGTHLYGRAFVVIYTDVLRPFIYLVI